MTGPGPNLLIFTDLASETHCGMSGADKRPRRAARSPVRRAGGFGPLHDTTAVLG